MTEDLGIQTKPAPNPNPDEKVDPYRAPIVPPTPARHHAPRNAQAPRQAPNKEPRGRRRSGKT